MTTARAGGLAIVVFAVAGVAEFAQELAPVANGFSDTDDPAVMLRFIREHPEAYRWGGLALFVMAASLVVAAFAVADHLATAASSLAVRTTTAFGLLAAAFFFGQGVLRLSGGPLLHIDGLNRDWGEAAYLATQMAGVHGFAQGALLGLSLWATAVSVTGIRSHTLPTLVGIVGIFPVLRLTGSLLGPLELLPEDLWIVFMASIVGTLIWCLVLGIVLLRIPSCLPVAVPMRA